MPLNPTELHFLFTLFVLNLTLSLLRWPDQLSKVIAKQNILHKCFS